MSDDMLKDAFERIAERADPVDGLAERALERAARRRRAVIAAGAAGLVAAIAMPAAVVQLRTSEPPAPLLGPAGLPANTPAERRVASDCMRAGPPAGQMGEKRPDLGKLGDFRLLAQVRLDRRYVATVGSSKGFVLCTARYGQTNTDVPTLHPWPPGTGKNLHAFAAPLRVDAIRQVTDAGDNVAGLHLLVGGRVKPEVKRVKVVWSEGLTGEAAVQGGFFLARQSARMVPDKNATGPLSKGAMSGPEIPVISVTGYGAEGRVLDTWRPTGHEGKGFVPEDCTDGLTSPRPALCSD